MNRIGIVDIGVYAIKRNRKAYIVNKHNNTVFEVNSETVQASVSHYVNDSKLHAKLGQLIIQSK